MSKQAHSPARTSQPIQIENRKLDLEVLIERGLLELFANHGAVAASVGVDVSSRTRTVKLTATGGRVALSGRGAMLKSIWQSRGL